MTAAFMGIGAFILIGVMFALLASSSRRDGNDPITEEVIIKANTATIVTQKATQEEDH